MLFSTIKRFSKTGFFHIFGSSVINKLVTFLSGVVLVRILTKPEYGIYSYADNLYSFIAIFSGMGVASGVLQMCSETSDSARKAQIYRYASGFGFRINALLAVVILLIAVLTPFSLKGAGECLALMCLLPFVQLAMDLQHNYLRADLRNREYAYANTFSTIVTFFAATVLSYLLRAAGLVIAHYVALIATCLFILLRYHVPLFLRGSQLERKTKSTLLRISSISMLNNGLSKLMYLLDILVLGSVIMDETVIASYKIATTIPTALLFIPNSIVVYIYPYFARNKDNRTWLLRNYRRLLLAMAAFNFLLAAGLVLFAPFVIRTIFGAQYLDALVPFRILCVSFALSATFRVLAGNLLITQRKLVFNLCVAIYSSGLNTALNVVLIRSYASNGAAIATLLTVVISGILNTGYLVHTFRKIPN